MSLEMNLRICQIVVRAGAVRQRGEISSPYVNNPHSPQIVFVTIREYYRLTLDTKRDQDDRLVVPKVVMV